MKTLLGIVAAVLLVAGAYYWYMQSSEVTVEQASATKQPSAESQTASTTQTTSTSTTQVAVKTTVQPVSTPTVSYVDTGFSPKSLTVKKGQTVMFMNKTSGGMWVATDEHPSHTQYSGTERTAHCPDTKGNAFDQCATGNMYSFTFDKVGTWEYHNHVGPGDRGVIVVTQ